MMCTDNYRMRHGRDEHVDVDRAVVSIWAWTTPAVAIPAGPLSIVEPVVPEPLVTA